MKKLSPFAPKEQQIEGLKNTLQQVSFIEFLTSLERLQAAAMMSKSHKHLLIKRARKILNISYDEYMKTYKPRVPKFAYAPLIPRYTPSSQKPV